MNKRNLRNEFESYIENTGVKWSIIEQDYVLSWVLWGIAQVPKLKEHLVFKGGTALKKCYFGDYRFSQDLDFSVQGAYPRGMELVSLLSEACSKAEKQLKHIGHNVEIACTRYLEKRPHPENQEAFVIKAKLPWHKALYTQVMVEVTTQETILLTPDIRSIIHGYGEELEAQINVYKLEEIVAEKVRALLQFAKKLHERGWGRSRVRDYYDIWSILTIYSAAIDYGILYDLTTKKCEVKGINFTSFADIFSEKLTTNAYKEWEIWLGNVKTTKHSAEEVLPALKNILEKIENGS